MHILFDFVGNPHKEIIYLCESNTLYENGDCKIIHISVDEWKADIIITIDLTDFQERFVRGFIYINGKEYAIRDYDFFDSLYVCDQLFYNTSICTLSSDVFHNG